eukprot:5274309-Pleurochrysis_carterae.AAC.1
MRASPPLAAPARSPDGTRDVIIQYKRRHVVVGVGVTAVARGVRELQGEPCGGIDAQVHKVMAQHGEDEIVSQKQERVVAQSPSWHKKQNGEPDRRTVGEDVGTVNGSRDVQCRSSVQVDCLKCSDLPRRRWDLPLGCSALHNSKQRGLAARKGVFDPLYVPPPRHCAARVLCCDELETGAVREGEARNKALSVSRAHSCCGCEKQVAPWIWVWQTSLGVN